MRDLFSKFLGRSPASQMAKLPAVSVALFGKHPAWGDHIDNLGDESLFLFAARNLLYGEGLTRQIGSGAWEKLSDERRLPAFDHFFVWYLGGRMLTGLLWSSSDSHGRTQYPLIVVAETHRRHDPSLVRHMLERMLSAKAECLAATEQAAVRTALDGLRQSLLQIVPREPLDKLELSIGKGFKPLDGEIARLFHELRSSSAHLTAKKWSSDKESEGAVILRVPLREDDRCDLGEWVSLIGPHLHPDVSILSFAARVEGIGDIVLGLPNAQNFFFLRASPKALPFTTEIPFDVAGGLSEYADAVLAGLKRCELPPRTLFGDVPAQKIAWTGIGQLLKG